MSLIQFVLANSPLLKTLTFNFCNYRKSDAPMLLKISQDLLRTERASPRTEVNFIQSTYSARLNSAIHHASNPTAKKFYTEKIKIRKLY